MTIDVESRAERIETGRSWVDLPPSPPLVAKPTAMPTAQAPETASRSMPWRRIGIGVLALVGGLAVGVWAPWTGLDQTGEPQGAAPLAADPLPDQIIPPTPRELLPNPPDESAPQDFFDQFQNGLPDTLFEFDGLPDGYQTRSNVFSESQGEASQRARLIGPDGAVDVQAIRSSSVELGDEGDVVDVSGHQARLIDNGDSVSVSWLAGPDLLLTVEAPIDVGRSTLLDVAESVEVVR